MILMPVHPHRRSRQIVQSFEARALKKRPFTVKIADFLTSYFGTVSFLIAHLFVYAFWIFANLGKIPGIQIFDPYPYSFLNSFVSIEALLLTVIVLMSQNRQNQRDTLRSELGLQVELISEKEITKILKLLKEISDKRQGPGKDEELEEMTNEIDASYIERKLEEQLSAQEKPILEIEEKISETIRSKSK